MGGGGGCALAGMGLYQPLICSRSDDPSSGISAFAFQAGCFKAEGLLPAERTPEKSAAKTGLNMHTDRLVKKRPLPPLRSI